MRIAWLPVAARNRASQLACVAERSPHATIGLGDAIETAVHHLAGYPRVGRPGRVAGTRDLVVAGTPYVMVYRVEPDAVVILRLLHGAQRWPAEWQGE